MRKTRENEKQCTSPICVSREDLAKMLGCGQNTADKIAYAANARIKIGKRVLIKIDKINKYLDELVG